MKTMAEVLAEHYSLYKWDRDYGVNVWMCSSLDCGATFWKFEAAAAHQAAALSAAGYGPVKEAQARALEGLLTDEALERSRKLIEDELIEWRDNGRFMLRNNGLAIRNQDGSGSEIIRFGFEMGMRIAVKAHMAAIEAGQ